MNNQTEQYIDTILVEADRDSAQEKHLDNNATWRNSFTNSIILNPGDKVSVYSAFINERGAESQNSVEFDGNKLGDTNADSQKTFNYTKFDEGSQFYLTATDIYGDNPTFQNATNTDETIELKDNEANITISYFKSMDCLSYIQLPRRFIPRTALLGGANVHWGMDDLSAVDNIGGLGADMGRVNRETATLADDFKDTYGFVPSDYDPIHHFDGGDPPGGNLGTLKRLILRNDGSRYTIFVRKNTWRHLKNFPVGGLAQLPAPPNVGDDLNKYSPPYYARDPEFFDYIPYKELHTIKADKGFSSSKFIAEDLTRQLTEPERKRTDAFMEGTGVWTDTYFEIVQNQSLSQKTYKPFRATNDFYNAETKYDKCMKNSDTSNNGAVPPLLTNAGFDGSTTLERLSDGGIPPNYTYRVSEATNSQSQFYYESFQYIALKRPEIYEAGSELNDIFGLYASTVFNQQHSKDNPFEFHQGIVLGQKKGTYDIPTLAKFKKFINSQELYPELFTFESVFQMYDYINVGNPYVHYDNGTMESLININNARFLHMNIVGEDIMTDTLADDSVNNLDVEGLIATAKLGCSYYDFRGTKVSPPGSGTFDFVRTLNQDVKSQPFFFHYDPSQRDIYYENPDPSLNQFTYGCFGKSPAGGILIYPNLLKDANGATGNIGLPVPFFTQGPGNDQIFNYRKVGFDRHWNAWGTAAIALSSGIPTTAHVPNGKTGATSNAELNNGLIGTSINAPTKDAGESVANVEFDTSIYNNFCYIGADKPEIGYDGNHFFLKRLHTPVNEGDLENVPTPNPNASLDVYKMNPIQSFLNYTPTQFPYEQPIYFHYPNEPNSTERTWLRPNRNLHKFAILDSTTGIFIEDIGIHENVWDKSLWGRLGFTYEQFNSGTIPSERNKNINPANSKLFNDVITTNAEITAAQTKEWQQNQFKNPLYNGQFLHPSQILLKLTSDSSEVKVDYYPPVVVPAESISILAENYPLALQKGYYAIRTDLIPTSEFAGGTDGNTSLPIIGIIDKQNPVNDFFIGTEQTIQFTINKKMIFSSVSIAITDPDGSFAHCDERSSVVFRIDKKQLLNKDIRGDIIRQIQQSQESQKK